MLEDKNTNLHPASLLAKYQFKERLDIMLSDFCPDICPWADIAVAHPAFTYGQN
jgi:hypothetical protein